MSEPQKRNPYHEWYNTHAWRKRSRAQRMREPLCAECMRHGLVVPAEVADHIEPHRGDVNKFWMGALQSLCHTCHSRFKQSAEVRGYSTEIGLDGWPVDKRHPAYAGKVGDRRFGPHRPPPRPAVKGRV